METGLQDDIIAHNIEWSQSSDETALRSFIQRQSTGEKRKDRGSEDNEDDDESREKGKAWFGRLKSARRPKIKSSGSAPPGQFSSIPRVALIAFLIAIVIPGIGYRGKGNVPLDGVGAGVVQGRADSPTNVCLRWSQQSALVNGTAYIYGGRSKANEDQTTDTWSEYIHHGPKWLMTDSWQTAISSSWTSPSLGPFPLLQSQLYHNRLGLRL